MIRATEATWLWVKKKVLCNGLGWHNYIRWQYQQDAGYFKSRCKRCGETSYKVR